MNWPTDMRRVLQKAVAEQNKARVGTPETLADVFRLCSPKLDAPDHLAPYVAALERAARGGEPVELTFHAPPQHSKTECAKHALILLALIRPGLRHAYATYNSERAMAVRNQVARLALEAGLAPHTSEGTLSLRGGTEIRFVGRGTALTGSPIDGLLIVDDILKDRAEAVSQTIRDTCWDWFVDVAQTRRHPGSSVIVMNTRWVQDDLIGRLTKRWAWPYVRLAAECDSEDDPVGRTVGEALWPKRRPLDWLQQFKRSPLTWASMYQGQPRPAGDALFQDAHYYDRLPAHGSYRILHGTDLAYTEKTRADWSVHVKGRWYPAEGPGGKGALFLTDLFRAQMQADRFTARLAERVKAEPGPCLWFGNTVERGTAALIRQSVPTFQFKLATTDKYVRALPTAEQLWNVDRLLVPSKTAWSADYIEEVTQFTGEDGGVDDQVDATAAIGDLALRCAAGAGVNTLNAALRGKGGLRVVA